MDRFPKDSWFHQHGELEQFARSFDPTARLALKESRVWEVSAALDKYATTIGRTVYIRANWTADQVQRVIPHEVLGHVKQFRVAGFGIHPTIGIPLGLLLYALFPIPIFGAWVRYRAELHAASKSWEYHLKSKFNDWTPEYIRKRAIWTADKVSGKPYAYAVPRFWARWGYKRKAEQIIRKVGRK